jgi:hypothetical protein
MTAQYASLHAGLLARKGEAEPAVPAATRTPPHPSPAIPITRASTPDSCRPAQETSPVRVALPGRHKTSLRLNGEQKRRLKMASAQMARSQQNLMSAALDAYLDQLCATEMSHCACLRKRGG